MNKPTDNNPKFSHLFPMTAGDAPEIVKVSFVHGEHIVETRVCNRSKAEEVGNILSDIYLPLFSKGKIVVSSDKIDTERRSKFRLHTDAPTPVRSRTRTSEKVVPITTPRVAKRKQVVKPAPHYFEIIK